MADLFISYSRRDEPFVERLREALGKRDRDVWLDREDIGPAVEWRREIELGIEGADVFAFVISPDALRSEPCRREHEYAVTKNKRIVPLLHREPEEISVPEDLASRNYIFFRTDEEFDPGVVSLLAAIEDLPEWARDHTRLLQRAEEWERSDRDPSFLLRGSDLTEAERWLSEQAAHKEPQPTPLQTEYLLASRKAATRRQRITIGAVGVALAVSVILGLVAAAASETRRSARPSWRSRGNSPPPRTPPLGRILGRHSIWRSKRPRPPAPRRPPTRSGERSRPHARARCSRCPGAQSQPPGSLTPLMF